MKNLESQIQAILERNKDKEADKAWETSWTRRLIIFALTYCIVAFFLWNIEIAQWYFHALVPTGGYLLSTLSIPWVKKWWINRYSQNPSSTNNE